MTATKTPAPPTPQDRAEADEALAVARDAFAHDQHADPAILDSLLSAVLLSRGSWSHSTTSEAPMNLDVVPVVRTESAASGRRPKLDVEKFRALLALSMKDRSTSYRLVAELAERLTELRDELSTVAYEEATASQVRANWARYLDVAGEEERIVYITRDGKRYAALVPPHIAETYATETAWFHTSKWQEMTAEAQAQYEDGQATVYLNEDELDAALMGEDRV